MNTLTKTDYFYYLVFFWCCVLLVMIHTILTILRCLGGFGTLSVQPPLQAKHSSMILGSVLTSESSKAYHFGKQFWWAKQRDWLFCCLPNSLEMGWFTQQELSTLEHLLQETWQSFMYPGAGYFRFTWTRCTQSPFIGKGDWKKNCINLIENIYLLVTRSRAKMVSVANTLN